MRRKWIVLPVLGFGLIALTVGAYAAWSVRAASVSPLDDSEDEEPSPGETFQAVQTYVRACERGRESGNQWLATEVDYAVGRHDLARLVTLCSGEEGPFHDDEGAALLTCRGLLLEEQWTELQRIRDLWRGREKQAAAWSFLDADVLLRVGRAVDAETLLAAQSFTGVTEARRLARLALTAHDTWSAHDLLARATALAPEEPDVGDCRGRLSQSEGRFDDALAAYAGALAAHGDDLEARDRLADCYSRAGAYEAAVDTWLPPGRAVPADFAWFKAWFWNRMTRPVPRDWESTRPDAGRARILAAYLVALPADQFWVDEWEFGRAPRGLALDRQETYWLRLLALLKDGQERQAAYMLHNGQSRHTSWEPDLDDALDRVLTYRAGEAPHTPKQSVGRGRHPLFVQLDRLAAEGNLTPGATGIPDDLKRLLGGDEAFAAVVLAAGWSEAALQLHHPNADLSQLPGWYCEALVRALWENRGAPAALQLVLRQPRSPELDLVAGELLVAAGRGADGLARFRSATTAADTGGRAAWLFALESLREGRPAEARRMLEAFPQLTSDVEGQTLLARCAAAEGKDDLAERLYREVAGDSAEARAYLAHRALAGGDWAAAAGMLRAGKR